MDGVLTAGAGAVLSHRAAGALWRIRPSERIDVTSVRQRRSRAVVFHRGLLALDEVTVEDHIPVTTPSRTLLDLAAVLDRDRLERAFEQAEVLRLAVGPSVPQLLERYPRRAGTPALRAILADRGFGANVTKGKLERRFLAFLRRHRLPRPQTNVPMTLGEQRIEADCVWPRRRLIVELDSRAFHSTPVSFEADRLRDRRLQAAGWRVIRVTWRQLHDRPAALLRDLSALLAPDKLNT